MNKQKKLRRKEFIAAAREIMDNEGYEACTVRNICERVGVAPSSFYNCFQDKDEVILLIALEVDSCFDEMEEQLTLHDPRENLALFMKLYFSHVEQDGYEYSWRFHLSQKGDRSLIYNNKDRKLVKILYRIIYQGRDLWYEDMDEDEIYNLIMTMLRGQTFDWARKEGAYSLSEAARKHIPAYVRAVFRDK